MVAIPVTIPLPVTLLEYSKTMEEGSISRMFVENVAKTSDLLANMKFVSVTNGKKEFIDTAKTPTVGFRKINTVGNYATGSFNLREEDTFYMDEFIQVDRAIVDRLGMQERWKLEENKSIAIAQFASQMIIKGDNTNDGSQPDGFQARCNNVNKNLFYNSTAAGGAPLSLTNLDKLSWKTNGATHWIFPRELMPLMDSAARNNTLVNQTLAFTKDDFGRDILKYKGMPILYGYQPDDTPDLLPLNEVPVGGGAAQTGSIYCVNLSERGIYGIEQTPLTVTDEGAIPGTTFLSTKMKWDWGIAREHPNAIARLSSISFGAIAA